MTKIMLKVVDGTGYSVCTVLVDRRKIKITVCDRDQLLPIAADLLFIVSRAQYLNGGLAVQ